MIARLYYHLILASVTLRPTLPVGQRSSPLGQLLRRKDNLLPTDGASPAGHAESQGVSRRQLCARGGEF
jgi:hypothetical protein